MALETIKRGIKLGETQKIVDILNEINIEFKIEDGKDVIYLNGENVTNNLRTKEVAKIVSQVSSIKEVRFKLNDIFRKCAYDADVIMEGRDIGTYVFPNANVKFI